MAQFARPDGDVSNAGNQWTRTDGSTTTGLWQDIDEVTKDIADYIRDAAPTGSVYEASLSDVTDPASSSGHVVRYTYAKSASAGMTIDITVALYQGATLIATWTHTNISNVFTDAAQTLTGTEADSITDYTDLRMRVSAVNGGGTGRQARLAWFEVEVPDAALADNGANVSWAELEVPTAPRSARVSYAELEIPTAPRSAFISWAEIETGDAPRGAQVSWAELETADAPRGLQVSWAELETADAPRALQVSWAEIEAPDAPRGLQVSWAELEAPLAPRAAQVGWAELEVPTAPRGLYVAWAEIEVPDVVLDRSALISWAELETADAPRGALVAWAELEIPLVSNGLYLVWAELEVPARRRLESFVVSRGSMGIPRTGKNRRRVIP